jgi:hypothetical protein
MLIIHGTKQTEKKLGVVADYCPLCHSLRPFDLLRRGTVGHLYYIPLGKSTLLGHFVHCRTCGGELATSPTRYAAIEKRAGLDIDTLAHVTLPNWSELHHERLAIRELLRHSPHTVSAEVRQQMLLEILRILDPPVQVRYRSTAFDTRAGLVCFFSFLAFIAIEIAAYHGPPDSRESTITTSWIVLGLGLVYTLIETIRGRYRFVQSVTLPALIRAWRPIQPTDDEVRSTFSTARRVDVQIARKLTPEIVIHELNVPDLRA